MQLILEHFNITSLMSGPTTTTTSANDIQNDADNARVDWAEGPFIALDDNI